MPYPDLERVSSSSFCINKSALLYCNSLESMGAIGSFLGWLNLLLSVEWSRRLYIISCGET